MPVLTDRQQPENPDDPNDPNDYAIRYLFSAKSPRIELKRTGQALFYSGAATNLLALALYAAWLELRFNPWLLLAALAVVGTGGLAAVNLRNHPRLAYWLAGGPLLLTTLTLLALYLGLETENAGFFLFFIPGSLTMAISLLLLAVSARLR